MAAIIGLKVDDIERACKEASDGEIVVVANINSPEQVVISGHISAVERASRAAVAMGAKKAIPLNVSGAFHSPLVSSAEEELVSFIRGVRMKDPSVGVIKNVDAEIARTKEEVIDALSRQLTSPVLWLQSMQALLTQWNGPIIEVGPGKVLAGLMKRIDAGRVVRSIGTASDIEEFVSSGSS